MFVDRPRPFIKKSAFGPVLIAVPALGFQHEYVPGLEPDEEVGPILAHHAAMDIEHLEAEMIVLDPGIDQGIVVQLEGFRRLPGAVIDTKIDMAPGSIFTRLARIPLHHVPG